MAPTKRKNHAESQTQTTTTTTTTRVTRSSTRQSTKQGGADGDGGTTKPVPKTKKAKPTPKQNPEPKKPKTAEPEAPPHPEADAEKDNAANGSKTVVIEHCKQCNQFKIRAEKVKLGLEKAVPGITVIVNPEKPRRGCFEVRKEGGKKFISLLEMKRPFAPMKALDMDAVISDIIDHVK
uniref:uncharacterized protein LOC122579513 n=1 Tax=Erigeron canadensis TaxID=72917 RepID=UPI001CB92BA9|nr:uncharacterized protein LOC122579513 [Erigeron canadensis]